jgi:nitrogen-specific signal transduction histidine kinase
MTVAKDHAFSEPMDLVLALGHEIGNLLAATRLHAYLIDADATATELSRISATIGELSSRMGSLLAQIRPLVSPVSGDAPNVDPLDVLDGLHRSIEESCDARVEIDLESADGLPSAVIDPEPLHHILLTSIYQALEESEPDGKVVVSAVARAESIVFAVDGEAEYNGDEGSAFKGRALLHAVADAILRPRRGQIAVHSLGSGNRVELTVPAARSDRA